MPFLALTLLIPSLGADRTHAISASSRPTVSERHRLAHQLLHKADEAFNKDPNTRFIGDFAELLARVGDVDNAERIIRQTIPFGRLDDAGRQILLADCYALAGDLPRAKQAIELIPGPRPNYDDSKPPTWLSVGRTFAKRGKKTEAEMAYVEARQFVVEHPDAWPMIQCQFLADVAESQYALGEKSEASITFQTAVERGLTADPREQYVVGDVAAVQAKLGLLDQASQTVKRMDEKDQKVAWSNVIEKLANLDDINNALRIGKMTGSNEAMDGDALPIANAYLRDGKLPEAQQWLNQAEVNWKKINDLESRITLACHISDSYATAHDKNAAAQWLDRALELTETGTVPQKGALRAVEKIPGAVMRQFYLRQIAIAQAKIGLIDTAKQTFERAKVAAGGEQPGMWQDSALRVIAGDEAKAGFLDDALRMLEAAHDSSPAWQTYIEIATAKAKQGKIDEAVHIADAHGGIHIGAQYIAKGLLEADDLKNALRIGLQSNPPEFALRDIAFQYGKNGDVQPILDAVGKCTEPQLQMALLLGAADGLLN